MGNSHNAFTVESVLDEAANLAGRDPLEYRLALLTNQPRHRTVLEQVAKEAGWGTKLPEGHARGIALHESFKSIVAQVVEVSVDAGNVRVHKVHCAIDCGRYVNPNIIRQQMEGGVILGSQQDSMNRFPCRRELQSTATSMIIGWPGSQSLPRCL